MSKIAPTPLWRWFFFGVIPLGLFFSVGFAVTAYQETHVALPAGLANEFAIRRSLTTLMNLSPLPNRAAPNFSLVDQSGRAVSLSQFRGKAVVLVFLDSRCTQVCPIIAQEFVVAERSLGADALHVEFVGVNVNPRSNSVADVARFTRVHGLAGFSNWHFLTGSLRRLVPVWRSYGIEVALAKGAAQTVHSSYLYFINPLGRERYLADATVFQSESGRAYLPPGLIGRWGRGIALYLKQSQGE